ncbi:hypothetical protein Tco_0711193 [Tanacetum coccineum]
MFSIPSSTINLFESWLIQGFGDDISKLMLSGNELAGLFKIAIALMLSQNVGTFSYMRCFFYENFAEAEVDSLIRSSTLVMKIITISTPMVDTVAAAKEKPIEPLLLVLLSSAGGTDPTPGGFSDLTDSDFIVGGIRTVISPDTDLQKGCHAICLNVEDENASEYNIREKRRLKSVVEDRVELLKVREKEVEDLKVQLLLKEAEAAEAIRLRAEASKFEAVEKSLQDEVKALKERNASLEKERDALDVNVTGLEASAMGKDHELTNLNAQLTSVKSYNDSLVDQVHELEVSSSKIQEKLSNYENLTERLEEFQDAQLKIINDKFDKLYADFVEMALHLEEKFYPHLLTTISGRIAAIGKAIEKGMQDGLADGITHGKEGRELTDVAAHNPSTEVDYVSALQQLQDVYFSLLADLKSNKDASVETLQLLEGLMLSEMRSKTYQRRDKVYDLWSMRMEQYLTHTNYAIWEVIVNSDAPTVASASAEGPIPPKIAEQKLARKNELKAKSTLLLAIPDDHLLKFHRIKDAKTLWEAIKTNQLEIHGEVISREDANLKLLRSLPSAWNNIALIMRNKSDLDTMSMDDLYNNLKVYEAEIKGQLSSSSNSQNVAFVSLENTSSTNKAVNTAHEVSSLNELQGQASSSTTAMIHVFLLFNHCNESTIDNEDLESELILNILKRGFSNEIVGFDKTTVECYNCHREMSNFAKRMYGTKESGKRNGDAPIRICKPLETPQMPCCFKMGRWIMIGAFQAEEGLLHKTFAPYMAYTSQGYQMGLKSLEARIVVHEKNEAVYEEDIVFLKYGVQVKDISIKDLKNQLEEALKEKDDLKLKLEKFEELSKNLTKLINS